MTDDFVSPWASIRSTFGAPVNAAMIGAAVSLATRRSMSPIVSFHRRRLPHTEISRTPAVSRRCATMRSAAVRAKLMSERPVRCRSDAIDLRMFSSVLAWIFGSSRSRPFFAACSSSSIVVIRRCWWIRRAVAGPTPFTRSSVSRPSGTAAFSSSWRFAFPPCRYCAIASPTDAPTFGIVARCPAS